MISRSASARHAGLEALGELGFERQRRDQRDEIGVAAALAEAVQRALHLPRAGADGGERIGDRIAGVVVGVDAETVAGDDARDFADDALDLVRQRSAVGVAEHRPARAGVDRRPGAGKRIFRIGLVAVEEMLAIDHRLAARTPTAALTLSAMPSRFSSSVQPSATWTW